MKRALIVFCLSLVAWCVLRELQSTVGVKRVPAAQAPTRELPPSRLAPSSEAEPLC